MTRASDTARLVSGGAVFNEASNDVDFRVEGNGNANMLVVDAGNDRVGIGLSSPDANFHVKGDNPRVRVEGTDNSVKFDVFMNDSDALIGTQSSHAFTFMTNDSERMRIDNSGNMGIGVTSVSHPFQVGKSASADFVAEIDNSSSSSPYGLQISTSGASLDNNTTHLIAAYDSAALRFRVDSDGDVKNHDNSYGSTSDQRIKQNIADATSQWDDIKGLRVRKYKLKDDIRQYGDDAKFKIGLIAQETETVSPNLISENSANANDILSSAEFGTLYENGDDIPKGKEVGDVKERNTTVKGIKYSILYMKAIKALQEAMTRIETLEAEVAKLKG